MRTDIFYFIRTIIMDGIKQINQFISKTLDFRIS